jgi:uncharacterized protein YjbI with pentapeptide repeats
MNSFLTSEYYQKTFDHVECLEDLRDIEFEECIFEKCTFDTLAFHFCKFIQCTFVDCLFISVKTPNCIFDDVRFRDCKLSVFNWTESENLTGLQFENCKLDALQFGYMDIRKIVMRRCLAQSVDFSDANLSEGDFAESDLKNSIFLHTNLAKANFVGAVNYSIDLTQNNIKKARFSLPEAVRLLNTFAIEIV